MDGSQIQTLHIVERDWRIDEKAEQPGSHKIPECNRNKEIDWPLVGCDPDFLLAGASQADVLPGFEADQHERHDFKCAEHRAKSQHYVWCSSKVKVMERPNDSSGKENHRREQHCSGCCRYGKQLKARQEE